MIDKNNFEDIRFLNNSPFNVTTSGMAETFPAHWHNYAEIIIVLQDVVVYSINEVVYTLHANDFLLIHPGDLHSLINNREMYSSYIMIQFDASFIYSLPDFQKHQYWIRNFHFLSKEENPALSCNVINLAAEIKDIFIRDNPYKDAKIYSRLLEMFSQLGEYVISDKYILRTMNSTDQGVTNQLAKNLHQYELKQKMIDVCSYLSQNCTQDITLSTAADYAGFSKYYFSRLFSEFTGYSFVEFLINERLKKAVELLLNEKLSITDVALMSGFSSISTFNRCFQKYRKDTPSNFRKKYSPMKSLE